MIKEGPVSQVLTSARNGLKHVVTHSQCEYNKHVLYAAYMTGSRYLITSSLFSRTQESRLT